MQSTRPWQRQQGRALPVRIARLSAGLCLWGIGLLWFLPIEPAPSDGLLAGGLAVGGVALLLGGVRLPLPAASQLVLLFAVVQLVPVLWAAQPGTSWFYGIVTAFLVAVAAWLASLDALRTTRVYVLAAAIAAGIILLLQGLQLAGVNTLGLDLVYRELAGVSATGADAVVPGLYFGDRPKGFFKDPNVVGAFLATATLWPVARLLVAGDRRDRPGWGTALLAALLAAATAATLSRAAVLGVAAGGAVLFAGAALAGRLTRRHVGWTITATAVLGLLALVAALGGENAGERFVRINPYDLDRAATWWRGIKAFVTQPIGAGPGMFLVATTSGGFGEPYAAHSTWVRLLVENGAAGFATFVAAMAALAWSLLIVVRRSAAHDDRTLALALWCGAALAATLCESFVIDTLHWRHFWVLVGIGLAVAGAVPRASEAR